jgi:hypothetical protein
MKIEKEQDVPVIHLYLGDNVISFSMWFPFNKNSIWSFTLIPTISATNGNGSRVTYHFAWLFFEITFDKWRING